MITVSAHPILDELTGRRRFGMRPGLETMRALMDELGNPQNSLKCVHVAGTNGKGSFAAKTDAVLRAAGMRTARYTSPHLVAVNERFALNGIPAPDEELEKAATDVLPAVQRVEAVGGTPVTFFECLTALAFVLFARFCPDVVLLETGLGGRLDATNILPPSCILASVVTRIGLDHCAVLGDTIGAIAAEKAGIMKKGRPVVLGAQPPEAHAVLSAAAREMSCPLFDSAPIPQGLPPTSENEATVRTALTMLEGEYGFNIPREAVAKGLASAVWPGRFQRVDADGISAVVDGAHNPDGAAALSAELRMAADASRPHGLIAGFCGDKDVASHLRILAPMFSAGWAVPIRNDRSLDPGRTAELMRAAGIRAAMACGSLDEALSRGKEWARASGGVLVVCGSLFLAGEALVALDAFPWPSDGFDPSESLRQAADERT